MKVVVVSCLLALVVVCCAQLPEPCQSPKQWHGARLLIDSSKEFNERARVNYDEVNKRVRFEELIEEGKERDFFDVLYLHNENKEYKVNLRTKKCNVTTISFPFRPIGVPDGAKFLFEGEIGAASIPLEHFTVVTFGGNFTQDNVRYATSVTYPDCVPVGDNYYNDITKYVESRYFDIRLEAPGPDAFKPSPLCTQL